MGIIMGKCRDEVRMGTHRNVDIFRRVTDALRARVFIGDNMETLFCVAFLFLIGFFIVDLINEAICWRSWHVDDRW